MAARDVHGVGAHMNPEERIAELMFMHGLDRDEAEAQAILELEPAARTMGALLHYRCRDPEGEWVTMLQQEIGDPASVEAL